MTATTFRTFVLLGGKTATGIRVPPDVVVGLGSGKKPAVRVTVGGHTYRSTVAVMGGEFMIPLNAQNRTAAGVTAGDRERRIAKMVGMLREGRAR